MSNRKNGQQTIGCNVNSCNYNGKGYCNLDAIHVSPCQNCSSGTPEDESMCASYKKRNS